MLNLDTIYFKIVIWVQELNLVLIVYKEKLFNTFLMFLIINVIKLDLLNLQAGIMDLLE